MTDKLPDHAGLVKLVWERTGRAKDTTPWIALLAVLELHKPWQGKACTHDHGDDWPCPSYVALATPFIGLVP